MFPTPLFETVSSGVDLTIGLNHYWDLDDDGTWADDAGTWGWSENGTVTVTTTGTPDGGGAAVFNADSDYLNQSSSRAWDGAQDNLTISFWVRYDTLTTGTGNNLFSWRGPNGGDPALFWIIYSAGANDQAAVVFDTDGTLSIPRTGVAPSTSTWYHLVLTDDGTTRRLYVDGTEADTDTTALDAYRSDARPMALGTASYDLGGSTVSHRGALCMMGMWDIDVGSAGVTQLYNSGAGLRHADL